MWEYMEYAVLLADLPYYSREGKVIIKRHKSIVNLILKRHGLIVKV